MRVLAASLVLLCAAVPALPAVLGACDPHISVERITEPWEDFSRSYANGAIRIFESFIDPNVASGAAIGILYPSAPEDGGFRQCIAIFDGPGPRYFAQAFIDQAIANYDPVTGLTITVPVGYADGRPNGSVTFSINQAIGSVTLR